MLNKKFEISIIDDNLDWIQFVKSVCGETDGVSFGCAFSSIDSFFQSSYKVKTSTFLLLDIYFGDVLSIPYIPKILDKIGQGELIMYSVSEDYNHLIQALKLGAKGYIIKNRSESYLKSQLDVLKNGGAMISPEMAKKLLNYFITAENSDFKRKKRLTVKELELLNLLSEGWTYLTISNKIGITLDGVRGRVKSLYRKLEVNNKVEALNVVYK